MQTNGIKREQTSGGSYLDETRTGLFQINQMILQNECHYLTLTGVSRAYDILDPSNTWVGVSHSLRISQSPASRSCSCLVEI